MFYRKISFQVVGYIDLSDSDDENGKINQKKSTKCDNIIEIFSSEEESERIESANKPSETPKKRRGRPRKNPENSHSPQKEDNALKTTDEGEDKIISKCNFMLFFLFQLVTVLTKAPRPRKPAPRKKQKLKQILRKENSTVHYAQKHSLVLIVFRRTFIIIN